MGQHFQLQQVIHHYYQFHGNSVQVNVKLQALFICSIETVNIRKTKVLYFEWRAISDWMYVGRYD